MIAMETNEIIIEDLEKLDERKEEINVLIERGANDLLELQEYNKQVQEKIQNVNDKLSRLKNVSKKIEIAPDTGNKMKEEVADLIDDYGKKASIVISKEELAIILIKAYNEGDKEALKQGNDFLEILTDVGVFWMAKAASERDPYLKGLSNILAYKTDQMYDDSIFVVGDGTVKALELLSDPSSNASRLFIEKSGVGTIAVGTYSYLTNIKRLDDLGIYTDLDKKRVIGEVATDSVGYFVWSGIDNIVATKIGGIAGGIVGAGTATAVAWGTTLIVDTMKNNITGDVLVDTFERGQRTYEVYRNGSGEAGTYDVILEKYSNKSFQKKIAGEAYSYTNYKKMLYNNWEDVHPGFRKVYGDETANKFNQALEHLKEIDNKQEAKKYIQEIKRDFSTNTSSINNTDGIYSILNNDNEFDLEDYYDYHHISKESE